MGVGEGVYKFMIYINFITHRTRQIQEFEGAVEHQLNWDVVSAIRAAAC